MTLKKEIQRIEADTRRIVAIRAEMQEEFRRIELAEREREGGSEKADD